MHISIQYQFANGRKRVDRGYQYCKCYLMGAIKLREEEEGRTSDYSEL